MIDADQIARELSQPGGLAYDSILKRFGTANRPKLRQIIFSDPKAKADLETLLHPLIRAESSRRIEALQTPIVLYEAALLVETGAYRNLRGLIVITAPREKRLERLITRDHCSRELAQQILNSQIDDQTRIEAAQFILENSGSLEDLEHQVEQLIEKLKKV